MVCLVLAVVSSIKAQYKAWWKPHPAQSKRYPGCREPFQDRCPALAEGMSTNMMTLLLDHTPYLLRCRYIGGRGQTVQFFCCVGILLPALVIIVLAYNVQFSSFKSAKDSASSAF